LPRSWAPPSAQHSPTVERDVDRDPVEAERGGDESFAETGRHVGECGEDAYTIAGGVAAPRPSSLDRGDERVGNRLDRPRDCLAAAFANASR
jgi:hypothetical protein